MDYGPSITVSLKAISDTDQCPHLLPILDSPHPQLAPLLVYAAYLLWWSEPSSLRGGSPWSACKHWVIAAALVCYHPSQLDMEVWRNTLVVANILQCEWKSNRSFPLWSKSTDSIVMSSTCWNLPVSVLQKKILGSFDSGAKSRDFCMPLIFQFYA